MSIENFTEIKKLKEEIAGIDEKRKVLSDKVNEFIKELEDLATETNTELDGGDTGYQVRLVHGRDSTTYDEKSLHDSLDEEQRKMIFTYKPVLEKKLLKAMIETKRLDESIITKVGITTPGKDYYKFDVKK